MIMIDRTLHKEEIQGFLQKHFSHHLWKFSLPVGTGNETYFAKSGDVALFIKVGVHIDRYLVISSAGLTPPVLASGFLDDGSSIIVQPFISGTRPIRNDYRRHLEQFASLIMQLHWNEGIKQLLPKVPSESYRDAGLKSLANIQAKWETYKILVPAEAKFLDKSIEYLRQQVEGFTGSGLVASHNDMCNYNWLLSNNDRLFLIDLDSMSLDDSALDIGATLWWYYPPELRHRFLEVSNCLADEEFPRRMQVRMAMHCLNIELPRQQSYDQFDPSSFGDSLTDFKAALAGKENPQGYGD